MTHDPTPARPSLFARRPRLIASLVTLGSILVSVALFLGGDSLYTLYLEAHAQPLNACLQEDAVRHHAYRGACAGLDSWGSAVYPVYVNDIDMRDREVRKVPLTDPKPRLLLLGDSFTAGMEAWSDTFAGMVADHFHDFDVLNGGVESYAPSNYYNVAREVLARGYQVDEVLVFIDISDVQDEAAFYRDKDAAGAVEGPARTQIVTGFYARLREQIRRHFLLTNALFRAAEQLYVRLGFYHLDSYTYGNVFDMERSAWTYRKVNETLPFPAGYAPLGAEGGIDKERAKMTRLWQLLSEYDIPMGVAVYPWPAQVLHDGPDPREERIWRDWCKGKCDRFITLYPEFRALAAQCPAYAPGCWYQRYFVFGDIHYNKRGNEVVARELIKLLTADPPKKIAP